MITYHLMEGGGGHCRNGQVDRLLYVLLVRLTQANAQDMDSSI